MTQRDADHWDSRYRSGNGPQGGRARHRLERFSRYVDAAMEERLSGPRTPDVAAAPAALDIACGAGGTVLWLAERGWHATGVDASAEALELAGESLSAAGMDGQARLIRADLDSWRPDVGCYDLVTCFFFLDRALMPALRDAIRPGGLLIVETFNRHWLARRPQSKPGFLLDEGELEAMATDWGWRTLFSASSDADAQRPTDAIVARRPES